MKDASSILQNLIEDAARMCSTKVQKRDLACIKRRLSHEGPSFLTITLPNFSDDFFNAVEGKGLSDDHFVGWRKWRCLPSFLRGFTSLVFCETTGRMHDEPNIKAVHAVRQICTFFKKVNLQCTAKRVEKALGEYIKTDRDLELTHTTVDQETLDLFVGVSRILISSIFPDAVDVEKLLPHHGPGSTEEGVKGNKKYIPSSYPWYTKLEPYFSPGCTMYSSDECWHFDDACISCVNPGFERPVKVITVPKTLKTPRVIALEPVIIQMTQQSIKDYIVKAIETSPLTKGHVNFHDQSINQRLALQASSDMRLATLDLSAASDRVHNEFVKMMFAVNPSLSDLLQVTRSGYANVNGSTIKLNKFSSMGSALCFPVESLFFTVCLLTSEIQHRGLSPSLKTLKCVMKDIYVYGDDLIIPVDQVERAICTLRKFGNVVGLKKSFYRSSFRESCGMDAFRGVDVTPIYLRKLLPRSRKNAGAIISNVATANLLFNKGFVQTASYLKQQIEAAIGTKFPIVGDNCAGLGWLFDDTGLENTVYWNSKLQRNEVRTLVPTVTLEKDHISGYNALNKSLIRLERRERTSDNEDACKYMGQFSWSRLSQTSAVEDLLFSPRRGAVTLKRRKVAVN